MSKFYLKDWHGKEKEFTDDKIFVRGEDGELIQFTQGKGASPDVRYVTFMSYDGLTEYGKKAVAVGDDCADPIARGIFATPTRESDAQYDYRFSSWATEPNGEAYSDWNKTITEDKTVYAVFEVCGGFLGRTADDLAYWSLSENNETLTIYGSGRTKHFGNSLSSQPWAHAAPFIKTANTQGVTELGNGTFAGLTTLKTATLNDEQTKVSYGTFCGCTSLTSVTVPTGSTEIAGDAFNGCCSLSKFTIPSGVTTISTRAFINCSKLTSISIPASVTMIEDAFAGSGDRKSVV